MTIKKIARAKINLCLHVTAQRIDQYHVLDSIVAFADTGDVLTFGAAKELSLSIDGPFADQLGIRGDNLVLQAARSFGSQPGTGAAISLQKNLPVAAGIGGGSADAAATLLGLSELWNLPLPGLEAQIELGADVPVCISGVGARMRGIGDILDPLPFDYDQHAVLVNPGVSVSTSAVFKALKTKNNPGVSEDLEDSGSDFLSWLSRQRNDLEGPAIAAVPAIGQVLMALTQTGARLARMSGSGATCFGVFADAEQARGAAAMLASEYPHWWVQTTRLTT